MSDLEGEDAFRIVLDRMIEATNCEHNARERLGDLEGAARDSRRASEAHAAALDQRDAEIKRLREQAREVTDALQHLRNAVASGTIPGDVSALVETVLAKYEEIPF